MTRLMKTCCGAVSRLYNIIPILLICTSKQWVVIKIITITQILAQQYARALSLWIHFLRDNIIIYITSQCRIYTYTLLQWFREVRKYLYVYLKNYITSYSRCSTLFPLIYFLAYSINTIVQVSRRRLNSSDENYQLNSLQPTHHSEGNIWTY